MCAHESYTHSYIINQRPQISLTIIHEHPYLFRLNIFICSFSLTKSIICHVETVYAFVEAAFEGSVLNLLCCDFAH